MSAMECPNTLYQATTQFPDQFVALGRVPKHQCNVQLPCETHYTYSMGKWIMQALLKGCHWQTCKLLGETL